MPASEGASMSTTPTDLADCTASQLLELYAARQASPVDALAAVRGRVERVDPVLHAFCHLDWDGAGRAARDSEARWQAGAPGGALDGVPVSIKDLILTRGWP